MRTQHMEKSNENTHVGRFDDIRVFRFGRIHRQFLFTFPFGESKIKA